MTTTVTINGVDMTRWVQVLGLDWVVDPDELEPTPIYDQVVRERERP